MPRPSDVAHNPRENTLTVEWPDGFRSVYPVPYLRGWCPCAGCQGHSTRVAYREAPAATQIAELWEVGAYALGVKYADGHDSGIYTWSWLRKIAYESPPAGRKLGAFEGGAYSGPVEPASKLGS